MKTPVMTKREQIICKSRDPMHTFGLHLELVCILQIMRSVLTTEKKYVKAKTASLSTANLWSLWRGCHVFEA